jgi:hypothetical protein
MWVKEPGESMQSTERKSVDLGDRQFLTVPDEINAGGLSIRFAPTIRITQVAKDEIQAHKWLKQIFEKEISTRPKKHAPINNEQGFAFAWHYTNSQKSLVNFKSPGPATLPACSSSPHCVSGFVCLA